MTDRDDNPRDEEVGAPPTAEEIAEAEALREALANPSHAHAAADFARSVALAHAPPALSPQAHRAILQRSFVRGEVRRAGANAKRTRATFIVAGGLAMAAAIAIVVGRPSASSPSPEVAMAPMAPARSTQPLFREPFARQGGESARIDRIASARESDLRDNRFASWGVR
jgi:hypothetical protein